MLEVTELYIYPVKSLAGIPVTAVRLTDRGFEHDRRWMLVDENNRFLSQREIAALALLQPQILQEGINVHHKADKHDFIFIPFIPTSTTRIRVTVWQNTCEAVWLDESFDNWFSKKLGISCRLVYMADDTIIRVKEKHTINNDLNSFSDAYPVLMMSIESLQDLNSRIDEQLPVNRFRPNIVFKGGKSFIEDTMAEFKINGCMFYGIRPSGRCVITTINQDTIEKSKEPLRTLAAFRKIGSNVYFGENVIAARTGTIAVGDSITILKFKESLFANAL